MYACDGDDAVDAVDAAGMDLGSAMAVSGSVDPGACFVFLPSSIVTRPVPPMYGYITAAYVL